MYSFIPLFRPTVLYNQSLMHQGGFIDLLLGVKDKTSKKLLKILIIRYGNLFGEVFFSFKELFA